MFPFFVCGGKLWWFLEGRIVLEVGEEGICLYKYVHQKH